MAIRESESAKLARLEERVSRDPSSPLFLPLAEAYRQEGRATDAERVLRAGLGHHKEHFSARTALGRVLLQLGRPEEARHELERVHRAVPENLLAARLLAEARRHGAPPGPTVPPGREDPASGASGLMGSSGEAPEALDTPIPPHPIPEDPPLEPFLPVPDPSVERRVATLRRFLAGATSLRGDHA